MVKFSHGEALVGIGLTTALFFSASPAADLLDPGFIEDTRTKLKSYSLSVQVLRRHGAPH